MRTILWIALVVLVGLVLLRWLISLAWALMVPLALIGVGIVAGALLMGGNDETKGIP